MPSNMEVRGNVEYAVEYEIQTYDTEQQLLREDYDAILLAVADDVFNNRLLREMRPELDDGDRAFIRSEVVKRVSEQLLEYDRPFKARFERFERVVCRIGGEHGWASGAIQALDEADPEDPTGRSRLPYVVKLDPPIGRLISVPADENSICRPEICFGKEPKDLGFTLRCKPQRQTRKRRFSVGERVACAVEDVTGDYTAWDAGTVVDTEYDIEQDARELTRNGILIPELMQNWDWSAGAGMIPYRVLLDSAQHIFVHRDVHWLIRDLALQPAGPRQSEDGTRNLKRLVKRRHGAAEWELIDHETRMVRIQAAGSDDDDSESEMVSVTAS